MKSFRFPADGILVVLDEVALLLFIWDWVVSVILLVHGEIDGLLDRVISVLS